MVTINVNTPAGEHRVIAVQPGHSLMEAIRDAGIDEMLALCGGCCSCSTCHVYVEEPFSTLVTPITESEDDLLDTSDHRQPASRLSCQIIVTDALDGMSVTLAPEN